MSDIDDLGASGIYAFNIVLEVKVRAMITMAKKVHPDYTKEQIVELLRNAIDYAINHE